MFASSQQRLSSGLATQNQLLGAIPQSVRERWFTELQLVHLPDGRVLHEPGTRSTVAYLPTTCIVSINYVMRDGASAEVAVVGNEGIVGVGLLTEAEIACTRAVVRSAGHALCLQSSLLRQEFAANEAVARVLLRHAQFVLTQAAQTAACNRHHSVDQQLCRWLLLSLDRLPSAELAITQERIASLLGVRREGVTEAAGKLQAAGLIDTRRGHIRILDRPRLETRACECYGVMADKHEA